jgi:hypothetical protein
VNIFHPTKVITSVRGSLTSLLEKVALFTDESTLDLFKTSFIFTGLIVYHARNHHDLQFQINFRIFIPTKRNLEALLGNSAARLVMYFYAGF